MATLYTYLKRDEKQAFSIENKNYYNPKRAWLGVMTNKKVPSSGDDSQASFSLACPSLSM